MMIDLETTPLQLQLNITFRSATAEDLPRLEWYGQYTHFREMFRTTFDDQQKGRRTMLLADLNGFPVGQIFILHGPRRSRILPFNQKPSGNRRGYLYALRVMDHLQGMGIGSRLLLEAEKVLRDYECAWSSISAAQDNQGARRLYERMGYQVYKHDEGIWSYTNHLGEIVQMHEPCWMLEKKL